MAAIMVIDDAEEIVDFLKTTLELAGHQVLPFANGDEAVQYLENPANNAPDLIMTDVMMPGLDGEHLCAVLRSQEKTKDVPVIVMTAKSQLRQIFQPGGNVAAFVQKPFNLDSIRTVVQQALRRPQA